MSVTLSLKEICDAHQPTSFSPPSPEEVTIFETNNMRAKGLEMSIECVLLTRRCSIGRFAVEQSAAAEQGSTIPDEVGLSSPAAADTRKQQFSDEG
nr:hypothetical protein Iba_chr08eCG8470 [Ipomoea batatas]